MSDWGSSVDKRWGEVSAHLNEFLEAKTNYPRQTVERMLGELNALYVVTQYAGSNSRTGWLIAMEEYRTQIRQLYDFRSAVKNLPEGQ